MARPLPVNLLMAGTGAVLLVSGISNQPIGEVVKGNFGEVNPKGQAANTGSGATESVADTTGEGSSPTSATFAPSPMSLGVPRHKPTPEQQARGIAAQFQRLFGISAKPTPERIQRARLAYERETGIQQFERSGEHAPEFIGGRPVI